MGYGKIGSVGVT